MPDAAIDACCIIDLLASGNAESILRASGFTWHLPTAVQSEVQYRRQYHPTEPGKTIDVPVDLTGLIASGVLASCAPKNQTEMDQFTHFAATFRSDGEAMCLAIAEARKWVIATDDRKAIRVARQAGLTVVSCPELIHAWADETGPTQAGLCNVLRDIQILAQFKPHPSMPHANWWSDELTKSSP